MGAPIGLGGGGPEGLPENESGFFREGSIACFDGDIGGDWVFGEFCG